MESQQPSARPWFRLASMARPPSVPTPTPAPPPQPRPSFVRPTFTQTIVTPTPQPPLQQQHQEPVAAQQPPPTTTQPPVPPPPQIETQAPPQPTELPQPSQSMPLPSAPPSPIAPPPTWTAVTPLPHVATISSVPTSPIIKTTTPSKKSSPNSTDLPLAASKLPPSPNQITSLVPSSPLSTNPPPPKPVSPSPTAPPLPSPVLVAAPTATVMPTPSPKIAELPQPQTPSPPHKIPSPRINTLAHPPSPLTLPLAQLKSDREHPNIPPEAEQKTILVHETIGITPKVHVSGNHSPGIALNGKGDLTRDYKTNDNGYNHKKLYNSEEYGKRVITITGENKGAIMELGPASSSMKKHGFGGGNLHGLHMKGNLSGSSCGGKSGSEGSNSNKEEGRMKSKDKHEATAAISSPPLNAFMNSNVQGVNNSILFNCSCTHHDPGVHLSLSRNTNVARIHGIQIKDSTNA